MNQDILPLLRKMYDEVKLNEPYSSRFNKLKVIPVFKRIIWQSLQNEPITNDHLTGLIHMFKHNCSAENFDKYLELNVSDISIRNQLSDEAYEINENGFTNAGKRAIQTLTNIELSIVKSFLMDAFKVKKIEEGAILCNQFISKNIPIVTEGIYSPWLFYINPTVFPLINDGIKGFKSWAKLSKNYDENIREFQLISKSIDEDNLGLIDALTTQITKEGICNFPRKLYLNDNRLFKISHGVFVKRTELARSGMIKILEDNKWISLSKYTGKGAGAFFENELKIGDFVYLCYGGDKVISVAKVTSDARLFTGEHAALIGDDKGEWIYREIEPLYLPVESNIADLKSYRSQTMPSGNSTFWEIKPSDLETLNEALFKPKFNLEIVKRKESDPAKDDDLDDSEDLNSTMTNNSILYGPPGTGKTFHSISYSVAIVEYKPIETILAEDRELVKSRFDQYVKEGQIVFTTFHQSLSYEDFIEGIKPIEPSSEDEELTYAVEDGIFKRLCTEAAFAFVQKSSTIETEKIIDFSAEYDRFVDSVNERFSQGQKTELETRSGGNVYIESISQKNNILVRHIDGNRLYTISKKRLGKISHAFPELSEVTNINDQFRAEIGGSNSSAYWAVLNAVRKQPADTISKEAKAISEKEYTYDDKKGIIESLKNEDYKVKKPKKFVLIIDEINRGNVSQIFGELITLIEDDKRLGCEEALKATLPYSKESFGVPCNISIIGTMNTADRSVEALDTALRRRFSFIPKMPEESELKITDEGIDLPMLLETINHRLRVLKDNDHTIGHAWFWNVSNLKQLKIVFENKILPLLQEYFYNDYEKLGLVLGDVFFELPHKRVTGNEFALFSGSSGLSGQYRNKYIYKLKNVKDLVESDFLTLTQDPTVNEF